ncbi:NADPH-dependent FMN reductase [Chromohalobacter sp. 296-RDG]|uniref:NADPH-dependent FMN reductase n=1 Tax=Chromohalobacter sp. 296-RDG TaxID=2994062 RepID=UPI002468295C|nr:NADPH-dependent FMN reductase [Chromohalobacter sp. 296-RDG]
MRHNIKLGIIYGSAREGRFCDTVAGWLIEDIAQRGGFDLLTIDPAVDNSPTPDLRKRVKEADAFIVVTPEYNHSFTGALKTLIDSFHAEWQAKPVGFVSYGGISGGLRAVEQLRGVFAELHAVGIRDSVSFANVWGHFDENGTLRDSVLAEQALGTMLARLSWWASALRTARVAIPYEEATA